MKKQNRESKQGMNRREFLKKSGAIAAVAGAAATCPKLVKSAWAADKEHILIGRPLPMTGPIAVFAETSPWLDDRAVAEINKDGGIYIEELGKQLPVKVKILDTSSDPTKAAEIGSRLIVHDKVDIMYVSCTPATVSPVAAVCERQGMPCVSTMMPAEMFLSGGPFHWSFNASMSVRDFMAAFLEMWSAVETNKVVGLLAQNDSDGIAWAEASDGVLKQAGFTVVDLGRFPVGSPDYTTFVNGWKTNNVEIVFANMSPPDFIQLWRQSYSVGFIPKIGTIGRALMFPSPLEAMGETIGIGTSAEAPWHPAFNFKSSLAQYSSQDLADAYEDASGKQWKQPIGGSYAGYEIIADVLKRAKTLDKDKIRKAFADTNLATIAGPTKFDDKNVAVTPCGGLQWVKGKKWPFEPVLVSKGNYPDLPLTGKLRSIQELKG